MAASFRVAAVMSLGHRRDLIGVAIAAILLNLAAALHSETSDALTLTDFRIVLLAQAGIVLLSLAWFLGLPRNIGAEVSGHRG